MNCPVSSRGCETVQDLVVDQEKFKTQHENCMREKQEEKEDLRTFRADVWAAIDDIRKQLSGLIAKVSGVVAVITILIQVVFHFVDKAK